MQWNIGMCRNLAFGTVLVSLLATSSLSYAQGDLTLLLNPRRNVQEFIFTEESMLFENTEDRDSRVGFGLFEQRMSLKYGVIREPKRELYVGTDFLWLDIDSRARFDESGERIPSDLYDASVGAIYRRTFDNDWLVGGTLSIGSASDNLFNSEDEIYLRGTSVLRIPHKDQRAWLFLVNLNTDRGELPIVPGVGYQFLWGNRRRIGIVGIPFFAFGGPIGRKFDFFAAYYPVKNADARISYDLTRKLTPYLSFAWHELYFSRANRDDDDDRITLEDKRLTAGIEWRVTRRIWVDAKAGYAFDRRFGEGDDEGDRRDNNIDVADGFFGAVGVRVQF